MFARALAAPAGDEADLVGESPGARPPEEPDRAVRRPRLIPC
jgi:hypothetical protein